MNLKYLVKNRAHIMTIMITPGMLCAVIPAVGCHGASYTKNLTNSSGRRMLAAKIKSDRKDIYRLSFANIRPLLGRQTHDNYDLEKISPTIGQGFFASPNPALPLQRLLKAGYVSQSQSSFTVPNVSGDYHADMSWVGVFSYHMHATYALTISMKPTDNSISGHYHEESTGGGAQWADGPLTGTVDANGTVHLTYGSQYGGASEDYTFKSTNGEETLTGKQPFLNGPNVTLAGHGPVGEISVPIYSYALSSRFEALPPPHQDEIRAGEIEIDQITNLLLSSDTMAQASFGWHADLNNVAKALSAKNKVTGTGNVIFGKQPDGSWVVAEYSF